jgi:hypothetical protein
MERRRVRWGRRVLRRRLEAPRTSLRRKSLRRRSLRTRSLRRRSLRTRSLRRRKRVDPERRMQRIGSRSEPGLPRWRSRTWSTLVLVQRLVGRTERNCRARMRWRRWRIGTRLFANQTRHRERHGAGKDAAR